MPERSEVTFRRDCPVIEIPSGVRTVLPAGTGGVVTQSLGGTFTVLLHVGQMVRVEAADADAIGMEAESTGGEAPPGPLDEGAVLDVLRSVFDPEIPVNIVDLGLVYVCRLHPLPDGGSRAEVRMTVTAPGCGMADVLRQDVENRVRALPGVREADVQIVWDPPWTRDRMSDAAKLQLGMF